MFEPVVHHNSNGPNDSYGSSSDSKEDKDDFSMGRNWKHGLNIICYTSPFV